MNTSFLYRPRPTVCQFFIIFTQNPRVTYNLHVSVGLQCLRLGEAVLPARISVGGNCSLQ